MLLGVDRTVSRDYYTDKLDNDSDYLADFMLYDVYYL